MMPYLFFPNDFYSQKKLCLQSLTRMPTSDPAQCQFSRTHASECIHSSPRAWQAQQSKWPSRQRPMGIGLKSWCIACVFCNVFPRDNCFTFNSGLVFFSTFWCSCICPNSAYPDRTIVMFFNASSHSSGLLISPGPLIIKWLFPPGSNSILCFHSSSCCWLASYPFLSLFKKNTWLILWEFHM